MLECKILGSNVSEDQWVCLGPGAKHGLRRIFDLESAEELEYTRLIRDLCSFKGPNSGFQRLGIEFPALLEKPLSLKNIEHALCEYDKYFRYTTNDSVRDRTYERKSDQDKSSNINGLRNCILCDINFQKTCHPYATDDDHSFLCECCLRIETAWTIEDYSKQDED